VRRDRERARRADEVSHARPRLGRVT
jgi:hypothetical protein